MSNTTLTISHHIRLPKDQRYVLHNGEEVEVIGICVAVWVQDGITSEPAKEIFCKYILKNKEQENPIFVRKDGFEITLPKRTAIKQSRILSDQEWLSLSMNDPKSLHDYYAKTTPEISSKNLLDIGDGGGEGLIYREESKIKQEEKIIKLLHYVCIDSVESLELDID